MEALLLLLTVILDEVFFYVPPGFATERKTIYMARSRTVLTYSSRVYAREQMACLNFVALGPTRSSVFITPRHYCRRKSPVVDC
jgi:hypothetical protein